MQKGFKMSLESRGKMRLAATGRKFSPEAKKKMSLAKLGKPSWNKGNKGYKAGAEHYLWKGGKENYLPFCECGKQLSTIRKKECQDCFHKRFVGENHASWKGGITPLNHKIRSSTQMKMWRKHVFIRDDFTCQGCGARSSKGKPIILNADHELPFALYPDLRFEILNGRTLCVPCHKKTGTWGKSKKSSVELFTLNDTN